MATKETLEYFDVETVTGVAQFGGPDNLYRYALWRYWGDPEAPACNLILCGSQSFTGL